MKNAFSNQQFEQPLQNNTSATGAYFCHLILYCKYRSVSLIRSRYIPARGKMSVHPRWKQERIELPQESKLPSSTQHHLVKKNNIQKILDTATSKSIMKSEKERNTKNQKQKPKTCELSCKKSSTLKCHRALKMIPPLFFHKEKRSKVKARIGSVVISPRHQNHKTRRQQTTLQNANQSIATAKVDRNKKEKKEKKIKNVSKPPINVRKISILTKPAWFRPSKQNCKQVKAFSIPITHPFTLLALSIRITAC